MGRWIIEAREALVPGPATDEPHWTKRPFEIEPEPFVNQQSFLAPTAAGGIIEIQPSLFTNEQTYFSDFTPVHKLYMGFTNSVVTNDPVTFSPNSPNFVTGKYGMGIDEASALGTTAEAGISPRRGTMTFWVRIDTAGFYSNIISNNPGPPFAAVSMLSGSSGNLTIEFDWGGANAGVTRFEGIKDALISSFDFVVGTWYHFIWSWQGIHHKLYKNGVLVDELTALSPMPITLGQGLNFGLGAFGTATLTLDEIGFYSYCFNSADVAAAYAATDSLPIVASGAHGMLVTAQWAPGDGTVMLYCDSGNDYALTADHYDVVIKKGVTTVATSTISDLSNGYGQELIPITTPLVPANTYTVEVTLKTAANATLATSTTSGFAVPSHVTWLGNAYGTAAAGTVQSPWTAISVVGTALSVWGRTYTLTGGWGLPQQISSQGQNLLDSAINIDFDKGSGVFQLTPQTLTITSTADDVVTWTGTATGDGITASIAGRLEYDGMVLIELTLEATTTPVVINTIDLQQIMPAARALWYSTASGYTIGQAGAYDCAVPTALGTFFSNTDVGGRAALLASVVLSDDDRGLEWFADNERNWQVSLSSTTPTQILSVESGSKVKLRTRLATQTFTLDDPITITFGYEATPIKSLPTDHRALQVGNPSGAGPSIVGMYPLFWTYADDFYRGQPTECWRSYALTPGTFSDKVTDTATVLARGAAVRANGIDFAPYTQMHTIVGPKPEDTGTDLNFLSQELNQGSNETGYVATISQGAIDYWLDSMEWNYDEGLAEGVYIDEAYYGWSWDAGLLAQAGWTDNNLVTRVGFNSQKIRTLMKRLRQQQIDHGLRPAVWIDESTGNVAPHMWAFVDYTSDGEGLNRTGSQDFIDVYNTTKNINWLRGMSRTQKFGWTQIFLNQMATGESAILRSMRGMLQMFDIMPIGHYDVDWVEFMQSRVNFGMMVDSSISFVGYWNNTAIVPDSTVICSYYLVDNNVFACFLNMTAGSYSGTITVSPGVLGFSIVGAEDAQTGAAITVTSNTFPLTLASHEYAQILLRGSTIAPSKFTNAQTFHAPTLS